MLCLMSSKKSVHIQLLVHTVYVVYIFPVCVSSVFA